MKTPSTATITAAALVAGNLLSTGHAFTTSPQLRSSSLSSNSLKMTASGLDENDNKNNNNKTEKINMKALESMMGDVNIAEIDTDKIMKSFLTAATNTNSNQMSEAIPFLARPKVLNKELAADFGFDPLNFAKDRDTLWYYREMEIKHARLAMLAAAGWPTSELLDRPIADYFNIPSTLDSLDRVPSIGSNNLDAIRPEFWGFCLGLSAAIDSYQTHRSRTQTDYTPGDLGWDPLHCADTEGAKKQLQLAEMQNGRLAMLAVTGFAVQEHVVPMAVVEGTPFFFQPITETAEAFLKAILE